jgi:hypothetical protein
MNQRRLVKRALIAGFCASTIVMGSPLASAKDTKRACTPAYAAYKAAGAALRGDHLHEAREQLQACLQSTCASLQPKCRSLNDKVTDAMPTVVLEVNDEAGNAQTDVQVKVDGQLVTSKLDGLAIPIEPGAHEFTFATDAGVFATQRIMVAEGQRDRLIAMTQHAPGDAQQKATAVPAAVGAAESTKAPEGPSTDKAAVENAGAGDKAVNPSRKDPPGPETVTRGAWTLPHLPMPYILGGAGVVAVAAGGVFTYWGNKDNTLLQNQCSPNCSPGDAAHVKTMYVAADVSFGAGLAALGVATWLFASSHAPEKGPSAAASVSITPTPTGAFASMAGAF